MIEEAAGVRMYESKKQSSLRTIEKKDAKVEEIKKVIKKYKANYIVLVNGRRHFTKSG